jgi:hypothetical protein
MTTVSWAGALQSINTDSQVVLVLRRALAAIDGQDHGAAAVCAALRWQQVKQPPR